MARVVLPIAGAIVGSFYGNPQLGWAIGSAIAGVVDPQVIKGPSIGEIAQQTSQEGVPRSIVFALSPPIAGNVIATSEPRIVRSSTSGKGGPKVETESVFRTYAIGVCEGPIVCFFRVWRNGTLVYDTRDGASDENTKFLEKARFFTGEWDQEPSPDLEILYGVGTTPAHRGTAYMVVADEDLTDLRGAIPQYVFQVTGTGSGSVQPGEIIEVFGENHGLTPAFFGGSVQVIDDFFVSPDTLQDSDQPAYSGSFVLGSIPFDSSVNLQMSFGTTFVTIATIENTTGFPTAVDNFEFFVSGLLDSAESLFRITARGFTAPPTLDGEFTVVLGTTDVPLVTDFTTTIGISFRVVYLSGTAGYARYSSALSIMGFRGEISCESADLDLGEVVDAICTRAGLANTDTTQLNGIVRGFMLTNSYPCYAALRSLSEIYLFDPANYDGTIHFVPRGENSVATVTEDDMLDDDNDIEQDKRSDAILIPRVIHLNYHDVAGGLNTDKQKSERAGDRRSVGEVSLQTAVVMTADEAARAVAINHKVVTEDQKGELKFSLPDSFLALAASNPIVVQRQGKSERCRIVRCDIQDGYQEYTLLRDRQSAYTSNVEGIPAAPQTAPPSSVVGPTLIEPLDVHILRDVDDSVGLGYYLALSGVLGAWQGATVELSLDGGANYIEESTWTASSVIGETLSVLADHPHDFPDEVNSVTVRIDTPDAELLETTLSGMLNRENLAIIGDELLHFAGADETTSGEWDVSYFLRGRKGTSSVEHPIGSRFVLIQRSSLAFVPAELVYLGRTLTFRATSFGATPDTGTVVSMVFTGRSQIERAPAYLQAHRDGDDVVLSWQGVGRLGGGAQAAHGAYFIDYHVTITDGVLTQLFDTTDESLSQDVTAFTGPITITVQQRNHFTGLGPSIEVIV